MTVQNHNQAVANERPAVPAQNPPATGRDRRAVLVEMIQVAEATEPYRYGLNGIEYLGTPYGDRMRIDADYRKRFDDGTKRFEELQEELDQIAQ